MKRYALVGVGAAAGFAAAFLLFPVAHGATDLSSYHQLDLFSDAFAKPISVRTRATLMLPMIESGRAK